MCAFLAFYACFGCAAPPPDSGAKPPKGEAKTSLVKAVDASLGKPVIITGIATGLDNKLGEIRLVAKDGQSVYVGDIYWSDAVRAAGRQAEKKGMDLWVTFRATITVLRASSVPTWPPIQMRYTKEDRYFLSYDEEVKFEQRKRQADGKPAIVDKPIQPDPRPRKLPDYPSYQH